MASIQQFFVTPNAATPDLFARFHKRTDRQRVASSYKPVRRNAAERANKAHAKWFYANIYPSHDYLNLGDNVHGLQGLYIHLVDLLGM